MAKVGDFPHQNESPTSPASIASNNDIFWFDDYSKTFSA